jgi:hypothetical protein
MPDTKSVMASTRRIRIGHRATARSGERFRDQMNQHPAFRRGV